MKKLLRFDYTSGGSKLCLGYLRWPWSVRYVRITGDLVEVFDNHGSSVFSLADVRLGDLIS